MLCPKNKTSQQGIMVKETIKRSGKNKRKRKSGKHLKPSYQKRLRFYQCCLKKYPTIAELRFRYALCKYFGCQFEFDYKKKVKLPFMEQRQFHFAKQGRGYIVDFYIPKYKIVFEVDGDSHEGREGYDYERTRLLNTRKIKVFRITNDETVDHEFTMDFIRRAFENCEPEFNKKKRRRRKPLNLSRAQELKLQAEYIEKHGVTRCNPA